MSVFSGGPYKNITKTIENNYLNIFLGKQNIKTILKKTHCKAPKKF